MTKTKLNDATVLVVGAGIMGAGIAQTAAQAGHAVLLFDMREGAAAAAKQKLATTFDSLVAKGRIEPDAAHAALQRIEVLATLADAAPARLVVEAIVEQLDAKRALFKELEVLLPADAVLATNTSSISVTAIANGLQHPGRLVGMHFFNPVPLMKLVEVVSGLQTDADVADSIFELSKHWGKTPVHARSTPGFIVNRIARPYYAETLAMLQETGQRHAATPRVLDACLKAVGFRMGPCELIDLIGHDTNFAVTQSVYAANFYDKRYVPSLLQAEMVAGGLLGRKSGRGFYAHPDSAAALAVPVYDAPATSAEVTVHGDCAIADALEQVAAQALTRQGWGPARERDSGWTGLLIDGAQLMLTDGRTASEVAAHLGRRDIAVFDRPVVLPSVGDGGAGEHPSHGSQPLAYAVNAGASEAFADQVPQWLHAIGFSPLRLPDSPGLIVARTLAMLINEAADAVQQGVCTPDGADAAMKLGLNYPAGPFDWLRGWSTDGVIGVLRALDATYRGERYRISPWLLNHRLYQDAT